MEIVNIFKSLADKNRLRIVSALVECEELCACQLTELLGVTGATASRHLAQLQQAGMLQSRKKGRWVFYRLEGSLPQDLPVDWLRTSLKKDVELQRDREKLEEILKVDPEVICRRQRGVKDMEEA